MHQKYGTFSTNLQLSLFSRGFIIPNYINTKVDRKFSFTPLPLLAKGFFQDRPPFLIVEYFSRQPNRSSFHFPGTELIPNRAKAPAK